jgi:hypothetical protein
MQAACVAACTQTSSWCAVGGVGDGVLHQGVGAGLVCEPAHAMQAARVAMRK